MLDIKFLLINYAFSIYNKFVQPYYKVVHFKKTVFSVSMCVYSKITKQFPAASIEAAHYMRPDLHKPRTIPRSKIFSKMHYKTRNLGTFLFLRAQNLFIVFVF